MSERRQVWETLSNLLARLEAAVRAGTSGLDKEVRKLGKAQFKANALAEDQLARLDQVIAGVEGAQQEGAEMLEMVARERAATARQELLEAILPALDGVENAMDSGRRHLATRDRAESSSRLGPAHAVLVSPADRTMLAAWLDGLRLVRERLLALLEAGEVTPIPTVGQPFDPFLHLAVATTTAPPVDGASGTIVEEERRGYRSPAGVLRYAEVVVYRPDEKDEL